MKTKQPKIGDKIYVGSSYSISNGSSDVDGGLATISDITYSKHLPKDHYNYTFVEVKEHPGHGYNWNYLMENQKKWKKDFGKTEAKPNPDIDTPWIENGDIVNGEAWKGGDVW